MTPTSGDLLVTPLTSSQVLTLKLGYKISRQSLGSGNFGVVNLATDTRTGRQAACKISKHIPEQVKARHRFLQEIDVLRQLDHVSITAASLNGH